MALLTLPLRRLILPLPEPLHGALESPLSLKLVPHNPGDINAPNVDAVELVPSSTPIPPAPFKGVALTESLRKRLAKFEGEAEPGLWLVPSPRLATPSLNSESDSYSSV